MTVRLKSLICFIVVMFVILGHAITLNIQSVYASENDNNNPVIKSFFIEKTEENSIIKSVKFIIDTEEKNLEYEWHIYKDSQEVYSSPYGNDNFIEYLPNQTGKYKAIVYVKDTEGKIVSKCSDECIIYIDLNSLVKPYVVIATLSENCKGFEKGEKVEVIRDRGSSVYNVKSLLTGKKAWIVRSSLIFPSEVQINKNLMTKQQIEEYVNKNNFKSKTKYFIWTDIDRQLVHVFSGKKGEWNLIKTITCATGKVTTPTVRGTFIISGRAPWLFSNSGTAKNKIRFYDNYYFHSVMVNSRGKIVDGRLGERVSHGCVRLSIGDINWMYKNIPNGTCVYIN